MSAGSGTSAYRAGAAARRGPYGDIQGLSGSQQSIIRAIIEGARAHPVVGRYSPRERRKAINTGLAVGYTEARYSNPSGGDRDSAGWRQERAMYYDDPTNVRASIRRFYDEYAADADKSAPLGVRAQQVQQSGTPNVWDSLAPLANQIRREFSSGAGGESPAAGTRGGGRARGVAPTMQRDAVQPGASGVSALLSALLEGQRPAVSSAGLEAPEFSARAASPAGYRPPPSGGGPVSGGRDVSALLDLVRSAEGNIPPESTVTPGRVVGGGGGAGGGRPRRGGGRSAGGGPGPAGLSVRRDQNHGAKGIAEWATRGIYGSGERTPEQNAAVGGAPGSDHLTTNRWASAVDAKYGTGAQIAKRLGVEGWEPGTYDRHEITVDGRRYSVQILENVKGHYDHTHLGVQRVR